jgi:hypothetical protein
MAQAQFSGHAVNSISTIHIEQDGTGTLAGAQWHRHYHNGSGCTGTMTQVLWHIHNVTGTDTMAWAQERLHKHDGTGTILRAQ